VLLEYRYECDDYKLFIQWTADTERSTVFHDIVTQVSDKHRFSASYYNDLAKELDKLTDKLYEQIYQFTDEHHGVPYTPRFRRVLLQSFSEICEVVEECQSTGKLEHENLMGGLFVAVVGKLGEVVDVYLADHAYQCKFRERLRDKESYISTINQSLLSYDLEDVLVQMTDLSSLMDCLSEKQRERLVLHTFMKYTMQEIADAENTTHQAVSQSISAALKKLRARLSR